MFQWFRGGRKQTHAPTIPELLPLTPKYEPANHGVYFDVLDAALVGSKQDAVLNIALTGSYGVGKSSILQKVAEKYPKNVVQVSLSTLGLSDESGDVPSSGTSPLSKTNRIQKEIVKQLLYREDPVKTPGSRFRRIGQFNPGREIGIALLTGFIIALVFYLAGWTGQLVELLGPRSLPDLYVQAVMVVVAAAFVFAIRGLTYNQIRVEKVSAGAATISLSQESTSFFDQYLDEIVYFFAATRHDIIIFEDIDRFDDPHIFETLRALNTLLNGAKQLRGRKIRFIYAIKDSIFDELGARGAREEGEMDSSEPRDAAQLAVVRANRTKFFDLVIPVVPFITHRNARDLMIKVMAGLEQQVSPELIDLAARHVADMRLIKNVRNEFVIFSRMVLPSDGSGLKLNPDSLFAMMLYKSTHLSDFEAVRTGRSGLDKLYHAGRELIRRNILRLNAEAREARDRLSKIETISTRSKALGARLVAYTNLVQHHLQVSVRDWRLGGETVTPEEFHQRAFWEELIANDSPLTATVPLPSRYSPPELKFTRADLSKALNDPLSLQEWQESDRASLQKKLADIQAQRSILSHADMHDLMNNDQFTLKRDDDSTKTFRQLAHEYLGSDLARQIVEAGYINRDFSLYTSTFYGERVSSQATNFIMHNVDRNVMDVHFELTTDDVKSVIRERGRSTLRERGMYNISVLDSLLASDDPAADILISSLQNPGTDQHAFLQAYFADGSQTDALIRHLMRWPRIFAFIVSEAEIDESQRIQQFDVALGNVADDVQYLLGSEVRDYLEANYAELQVLISPSTDAETAALVADLLAASEVYLPSVAPLAERAKHAVVAKSRYVVTRDNLVLALGGLEDLALDLIQQRSPVVYRHVLHNLTPYLAGFPGDEIWPHTVKANTAFASILEDLKAVDDSHLDAIVTSASAECVVESLAAVPPAAWPALAKHCRFPLTFGNVAAYIDAFGVDDCLAATICAGGAIDVEETNEDERQVLAAQILNAHDVLPDPNLRVDVVASLGLRQWLPITELKNERGPLIGLLIEKNIIADDADSFALTLEMDWPTREFAISKSQEFPSYMTPVKVPVSDIAPLVRSDRVPHDVKSAILDRLPEFTKSASKVTLAAVAEFAHQAAHKLKPADVMLLASGGVKPDIIVSLLEPLLPELSLDELRPVLQVLGGKYRQLIEPLGKRPNLPDTPAHRALAERLQALGTVSSYKVSGGMLRIAMRRTSG
jgi:hypothetical protein